MLEQSAAVGVVHRLGRRVLAQRRAVDRQGLVGEAAEERPATDATIGREAAPEVVDVLAGGRDESGLVEAVAPIVVGRLATLVEVELELLAVPPHGAAEGDEAGRVDSVAIAGLSDQARARIEPLASASSRSR